MLSNAASFQYPRFAYRQYAFSFDSHVFRGRLTRRVPKGCQESKRWTHRCASKLASTLQDQGPRIWISNIIVRLHQRLSTLTNAYCVTEACPFCIDSASAIFPGASFGASVWVWGARRKGSPVQGANRNEMFEILNKQWNKLGYFVQNFTNSSISIINWSASVATLLYHPSVLFKKTAQICFSNSLLGVPRVLFQ